jgi:hypothetical protein
MLNKKQIINFLNMRNDTDSLGSIKNVIILSMIKYYKDMSIIDIIDNINIYYIDRKDFIVNTILNNHSIGIPTNIPLITKIEGLLLRVNYLYQYKTLNINTFSYGINTLQVEDIMKELIKISNNYDIQHLEELKQIDYKKYRVYSEQSLTNIIRPLFKYIKKIDKKAIKDINLLQNYMTDKYEDINKLYITSEEEIDNYYLKSEIFRKIKDLINSILKELEKSYE